MAKEKKKDKENKVVLERKYNVHIRNSILKVPQYKRASKAIKTLREFLIRNMKSDKIKIGKYLNLKVWEHGIKNPPVYLKITTKRYEDGVVYAELEGAPEEAPVEPKKAKKAAKAETPAEKKVEEIKEAKQEEAKETQKEEISELKAEHPKQHAPKEPAAPKNVEAKELAPQGRTESRKP